MKNPVNDEKKKSYYRVDRGGAFVGIEVRNKRSSFRTFDKPIYHIASRGFRVVRTKKLTSDKR